MGEMVEIWGMHGSCIIGGDCVSRSQTAVDHNLRNLSLFGCPHCDVDNTPQLRDKKIYKVHGSAESKSKHGKFIIS